MTTVVGLRLAPPPRRTRARPPHALAHSAYWASTSADVATALESSTTDGLSAAEAEARAARYGTNELVEHERATALTAIVSQVKSPLMLLLVFAAGASALTGEVIDAVIVAAIVVVTVGVGASREYSAQRAAALLKTRIQARATVVRGGAVATVAARDVVPGDLVALSAGSVVPADGVLVEATDCFVNEAVLTGESFPVLKAPGTSTADAPLSQRTNCVLCGSNVRSGSARFLVVATGAVTQYGAVAHQLSARRPETELDRSLRRFGNLLASSMLVMVVVVLVANVVYGRPAIEALLFSVALAVGLSPELLPAILSVNLARGARAMGERGVLVRHLNAIENLGSMDVLCTDKTGTLTEGVVRLDGAFDAAGAASAEVLHLAALNAALETGLNNPLDEAILQAHTPDLSQPAPTTKIGEIPYDFVRKRLGVVVERGGRRTLIVKGAFEQVLAASTVADDEAICAALRARVDGWAGQGIRVLAVATREVSTQASYTRDDERDLTLVGMLTFLDRPKADAKSAIDELVALGVQVKIITGDAMKVAQYVAGSLGLRADRVLRGSALAQLPDEALWRVAEQTDLFVEVDPNQKERIILALKKMGHVVGFMGDGVNDAPAMHAADTSLSVDKAVDVAREAADFVLLEQDLRVIRRGIEQGRRTFANTLKYILTTTSANLGNMASMAVASLFLPFLPLTAGQILLNNFLSDVPAFGLADDDVDRELVDQPRRFDLRQILRFMLEFGALSSLFDLMTFAVLLNAFHAAPAEFRTCWFVESLLTELVIALVVRTRRPFFRSRPGRLLLWSTVVVVAVTFAIPFLPFLAPLGFVPLPATLLGAVSGIAALYVVATELLKAHFFRTPRQKSP